MSTPEVTLGSTVKIREEGETIDEVFHIVSPPDVDVLNNCIPLDNAMGQALKGSKPGDKVTVEGPVGPINIEVLEVDNDSRTRAGKL